MSYMQFRPKRYGAHCSIDVLFHAGALCITRAVAVSREKRLFTRDELEAFGRSLGKIDLVATLEA